MELKSKSFPDLPSYKGAWWPLYMEPIIGSGEKITVAVIAEGNDGEIAWHRGLSKKVITSLGKEKSSSMSSLINTAVDHYIKGRTSENMFCEIPPPFTGVQIGDKHETLSSDLIGILEQALRTSCVFADIKSLRESNSTQQNNRFLNDIREITIETHPQFTGFFQQSFKVSETARRTPIDFIGHHSAINFAKFPMSTQNLSYYVGQAKIKLWNLNSFRAFDQQMKNEKYELILLNPEQLAHNTLTEHQRNTLFEGFNELVQAADAENIRITQVEDTIRASGRLIHLEAA